MVVGSCQLRLKRGGCCLLISKVLGTAVVTIAVAATFTGCSRGVDPKCVDGLVLSYEKGGDSESQARSRAEETCKELDRLDKLPGNKLH